jgi:acetyl-CoA carboxylase carboxyltransferase component
MVKVVEEIVDDGIFVELFEAYADNIIIGFARLEGRTIGVVGISQRFWLVVWTLMHQSKQPDLSEPVMRSIFLLSPSKMSRIPPGVVQNGAASFGMVPNCCLPMQKRRYRN